MRSVWEDLAVMKTILPDVIITVEDKVQPSHGPDGDCTKPEDWGADLLPEDLKESVKEENATQASEDSPQLVNVPSGQAMTQTENAPQASLPAFSCIGSICIEGTKIAYPLMQSEDESFFLTHDSGGKKNRNGAIFLEPQNAPDLSDPVNYVFGHNMKSGLMFGTLKKFLKPNYLKEHDRCTVTAGGASKAYRLVAAASVDAGATLTRFNGECLGTAEYASFVEKVSEMMGAGLPSDAQLIFLITCSGKKTERIVVCGILETN